ncbi:ribonuclease domain-containing protein [Micropruina sp.]|uniref:ribonuclease domain-containing protein n=1 Tax=Micropruina sp. TaxID=2737536 RepID=UPI0039E5082F
MSTARRRTLIVVGLVLLALLGLAQLVSNRPADTAAPSGGTASVETRASAGPAVSRSASGLPVCGSVPAEVGQAVAAVRNNGPYLRPRNDGGIFGNREGLLPTQPNGFYREYTVEAPGQRFPGPRRLITGGQARLGAEPTVWFYTADHYESFCALLNP